MTTIETITQNANTLAEGYEPEALARAFWTLICEPNDLLAGELINTLGPIDALEVATGNPEVTDSEDLATLRERVTARANSAQFAQILRVNRPRFDAVSFRVWKENIDHAEEDSRGDEAACDAARSRSFG